VNAAEDYLSETSQRELAVTVLKQAAQDLRRFHGATSAVEHELYLDAYSWVKSDDCSWPFSFINVCHSVNLAPEIIRENLIGDASLGWFRYWTRRCGRTARKFRIPSHAFTRNRNSSAVDRVPLTERLDKHEKASSRFRSKLASFFAINC
jgi:hypothetical protein